MNKNIPSNSTAFVHERMLVIGQHLSHLNQVNIDARFEIFTAVMIEFMICWVVSLCNVCGWMPTFWRTALPPSSGSKCTVNEKWI